MERSAWRAARGAQRVERSAWSAARGAQRVERSAWSAARGSEKKMAQSLAPQRPLAKYNILNLLDSVQSPYELYVLGNLILHRRPRLY